MPQETVGDAMTASPSTVDVDATVVDAAKIMASQDVGSVPVVDGDELVGMITDRDLVLRVLAKDLDPHKLLVSNVYSESPVVARVDEPLEDALGRMAREQVRRLPVVEDGRLVGILAQADVSRSAALAETGWMVEEISQE
jgi:CBS domain-containing protein